MLPEFGEGAHDHRHDQFGRDKLSERQLSGDHKPTADAEQRGARDGLQPQREHDLPHQDPEVASACLQIIRDELIGAIRRELGASLETKRRGAACEFLEPSRDFIFLLRFDDARLDRASSESEGGHRHQHQQHGIETKEPGVIKGKDRHADRRAENDGQTIEQKRRHDFLDRDHIEETIDQLGSVLLVVRLLLDSR